jgi:hypothetical protein
MSRVDIIHYTGATAKSFSVVASIAADIRSRGDDVTVIDLQPTTVIQQGYPSSALATVFGHRVKRRGLSEVLQQCGARFTTLPLSDEALEIPLAHLESLSVAIESELLTYFRRDHVPRTGEASKLRQALELNGRRTYGSLHALWEKDPPQGVVVPNGRTSRQKAARLVAESLGIPVRLYENGRAQPHSYYLGTTQPHDRIASQAEVASLTRSMTQKHIQVTASRWLDLRMAGSSGTNAFSALWDNHAESPNKKQDNKPERSAVFFASSFDEFLAFGPMWTIDEWSSQFEAFDLIMSILEKRGVPLVLRLHPNLATKSRAYFLREVKEILALHTKHPSLTIYWHNSSANSYGLVSEADYVVVERSTIGLEASLMGKPVWVTQACQWDHIADVRQLLEPSDITEDVMTPWQASPSGAQRFVAYWVAQEHPLRYDWSNWASWDPENAPLAMKLLQLTLRNSWQHKLRLVSLEWSKFRNNRFTPPARARSGH